MFCVHGLQLMITGLSGSDLEATWCLLSFDPRVWFQGFRGPETVCVPATAYMSGPSGLIGGGLAHSQAPDPNDWVNAAGGFPEWAIAAAPPDIRVVGAAIGIGGESYGGGPGGVANPLPNPAGWEQHIFRCQPNAVPEWPGMGAAVRLSDSGSIAIDMILAELAYGAFVVRVVIPPAGGNIFQLLPVFPSTRT